MIKRGTVITVDDDKPADQSTVVGASEVACAMPPTTAAPESPWSLGDDAQAGDHRGASPLGGDGDAPTTIHEPPSAPETVFAYSDAIELPDLSEPRSRVPAILFAGATAALAAAVTTWFFVRPVPATALAVPPAVQSPPTTNTPPAKTVHPIPDSVVAQAIPDVPDAEKLQSPAPPRSADDVYINQLTMRGLVITNRANAVSGGREVCYLLSQGSTDSSIVPLAIKANATLTVADAEGFIGAAITSYCPQYSNQLGRY